MSNGNGITNVDTSQQQRAVYHQEKTTTDFNTGEVIQKEDFKISKESKKENFIKMFIENLYFMATELNNSEKTVLFFIMANMNYKNVITVSTELREIIKKKAKISRTTVYTAIEGLKDKNVLLSPETDDLKEEYEIYSKNSYLLNPNVIGKGGLNDLKKLRQTVITDFDFSNMEAKQEIIKEVAYEGAEEIKNNPESVEVAKVEQSINQNTNHKKTNVIVKDKEPDYEVVTVDEVKQDTNKQKTDIEIKLELAKEQNKTKELEIEDKKLEIQLLKLKKDNQKQGTLDLD